MLPCTLHTDTPTVRTVLYQNMFLLQVSIIATVTIITIRYYHHCYYHHHVTTVITTVATTEGMGRVHDRTENCRGCVITAVLLMVIV